jgi:hypothetical protein
MILKGLIMTQYVMLNSFQHLNRISEHETLNHVQGDRKTFFSILLDLRLHLPASRQGF